MPGGIDLTDLGRSTHVQARLPGESIQEYQRRLARLGAQADAALSDVGLPPAQPMYPATGPQLGDYATAGTASLPQPTYTPAMRIVIPPEEGGPPRVTPPPPTLGVPAPAARYAAPGGAIAPGLREPRDPTPYERERERLLALAQFDLDWGTPPAQITPNLKPGTVLATWDPSAALYVPAATEPLAYPYRSLAAEGVFAQAYKEWSGGPWLQRWVHRTGPGPYTPATDGEAAVYRLRVQQATGPTDLLSARAQAGTLKIEMPETSTYPTSARLVTRSYPLSAYAWVPQKDLPLECPYPYGHMPVPQADYVSGRWLDPDYVPSIPLPPPYDQVPWQCGVPEGPAGTPPKPRPFGLPEDVIHGRKEPPPTPTTPAQTASTESNEAPGGVTNQLADLDVGIPTPTGSAAPGNGTDASDETKAAIARAEAAAAIARAAERTARAELDKAHFDLEVAIDPVARANLAEEIKRLTRDLGEAGDLVGEANNAIERARGESHTESPGAISDVGMPAPVGPIPASANPDPPRPPPPPRPAPTPQEKKKTAYLEHFDDLAKKVKKVVEDRENLGDNADSRGNRKGGRDLIEKALQDLRAILAAAAATDDFPAPANLKAIVWTLEQYTTPSIQADYAKEAPGRAASSSPGASVSQYGKTWKCNKLVADAYAVGADVGLSSGTNLSAPVADASGHPLTGFPAKTDSGNFWGPMANDLAKEDFNLRSLTMARPVDENSLTTDARRTAAGTKIKPKPGDIVAFPSRAGLGHSSLYLGNGLIASAKGSGVEIGTIAYEIGPQRPEHSGTAMVRQWTGTGR